MSTFKSTFFTLADSLGRVVVRTRGGTTEWKQALNRIHTPSTMPSTRSNPVEDSDSLATSTDDDSLSLSVRVKSSSTKTSTPATSVMGKDERAINSKKRSTSSSRQASHSDSELSALDDSDGQHGEALGSGSRRKRAKVEEASRSAAYKTADTPKTRASNATSTVKSQTSDILDATNNPLPSSGGSRRSRRANSPEVVVYVNNGGSRASNSRTTSARAQKTGMAAGSSSPLTTITAAPDSAVMKKEEASDGEETEDDLAFRNTSTSKRKNKGKAVISSEDEEAADEFVPSDIDELKDVGEVKEEMSLDSFVSASQLIARQVAKNISDKLASSPLAKGAKGKASKAVVTTLSSKTKTITTTKKKTLSRRELDKLKKEVVSGSNKSKKGKGKNVVESSDEEGDDDFVVDSAEEDEEDDEVISEDTDASSDLSDIDENDNARPAKVKKVSAKSTKQAVAKAAREARKAGKKLSWWQKNEIALQQHHHELRDVWDDLRTIEVVKPQQAEQPTGLTMKMLPFQLEGLFWLLQQEKGPWKGGLLADEMGMGKTIQMISLVLSDFDPNEKEKKHTLVLAPTVAIMQWRNEFNKFTSGMKVCVWHGGNRTNDRKELLKYDVILTSYAVLESSFRRQNQGFKKKGELIKEDSVLHSINWHRVILDEAHNIKDRSCNTARGAFALKANFRWCLSGTPLQNRVGELYSLIRFIGVDPFAYYYCKKCPCKALHWRFSNKRTCDECGHTPMHHICYWNNEILKPIQKYGAMAGTHGAGAFDKLSLLLARMMLRRTKVERADDMGLPPRAIQVRRDYFTEEEEEFYTSLYSDVKRTFSTYVAADSLLNNYANVFQLLTRMRQTACHPDMVLKGAAAKALLGENASKATLSISTCRLCLDEGDDPIMSKCRHVFCRECIRQYLETAIEVEPECPVCHLPLTIDLNQETEQELLDARQGMLSKIDPGKWRTSTKIEALVEELSQLKTEDHSIKSLVFSQFTSFLDLIARRLQLAGFKIARLQGNMTPEARDRTVKYFMNNNECTVFLLSLKAGGVALNLTEASRVFIMDPWWNPAAELQAMDRIHRIGQHRPVVVKRLIIENSIESKIVELQKKKENMTGAALGDDDQALGRLTPEDLSFLFVM